MPLIKVYNKKRNVTYVYENYSYYSPEHKQSRSHRKLIGKLDPETGEIVPTGKRGRPRKNQEDTGTAAGSQDEAKTGSTGRERELEAKVESLQKKNDTLQEENKELGRKVWELQTALERCIRKLDSIEQTAHDARELAAAKAGDSEN